jgi:hypothetical protein
MTYPLTAVLREIVDSALPTCACDHAPTRHGTGSGPCEECSCPKYTPGACVFCGIRAAVVMYPPGVHPTCAECRSKFS